MKKLLFSLLILSSSVSAANIPDLTCFQIDGFVVRLDAFNRSHHKGNTTFDYKNLYKFEGYLYRIKNNHLYVTPPGEKEYLYKSGPLTRANDGFRPKYVTGDYMIHFQDDETFNYAIAVKADFVIVEAMTLYCSKS